MEYKKVKRILDVLLAVNCSIILSPILAVTAILVKADSKGPIIFKQSRTGKYGKTFNIYKFRTMAQDNDVYNFEERDRVTNIGKVLRKYGIDELPQLLNILKGDMSFIGPRPYPSKYYDYFTEEQKKRLDVLPGLLGPSVCKYTKLSILEKNNLDSSYVDNFSFKQDLDILLSSVLNSGKILSFREKSAYGNKDTVKNDFICLKNNLEKEEKMILETKSDQVVQSSCMDYSSIDCCCDYLLFDSDDFDNNLSEDIPLQKKIGVRRYNK